MKRTTVCLFACVTFFLASPPAPRAQAKPPDRQAWQELLKFRDRDLRKIEDVETLDVIQSLANRVIPGREQMQESAGFFMRRPWLISEITAKGGAPRFVLLDTQAGFMAPGQSISCVYLIDAGATTLGSTLFSTGWRMMPTDARVVKRDEVAAPLLEVSAAGVGGFANAPFMREYFALRGGEAILVRLEDKQGKALTNAYGCPYPSVGPPVVVLSVESLAKSLSSTDEIEILRALMWLAGRHQDIEEMMDEHEFDPDDSTLTRCPGAVDDARLHTLVLTRPEVREALTKDAASANAWIGEAAGLVLNPPRR